MKSEIENPQQVKDGPTASLLVPRQVRELLTRGSCSQGGIPAQLHSRGTHAFRRLPLKCQSLKRPSPLDSTVASLQFGGKTAGVYASL